MVNEERVKLMTRMAAYEEGDHKKNKNIVFLGVITSAYS